MTTNQNKKARSKVSGETRNLNVQANRGLIAEQLGNIKGSNKAVDDAIWLTSHEFPLVPDENINLISLTGEDYPKLCEAFGKAWQRLRLRDRKMLTSGWRKRGKANPHYPSVPWIVAIPFWPGRAPEEFGLTHPSGCSIRFIAPLIERMPEDLAIGVVVKQLALAYCYIRCGITWDASWAVRPSVTLPEDWEYVRKAIGINAGYTDLDKRLADWSNEPAMADLSQELEKDAFWYFDSIGQDAGLIYR